MRSEHEFTFDPDTHTYFLDREKIPSVTQLTDIYSTVGFDPDSDMELTLEAAAERGITLHAYLEHRFCGGDRGSFELPDVYQVYADGVDLFLAEHDLTPSLVETPLWGASCDGFRFAGTPDYVGDFDGVLSILDWKFVSQVQKTKVCAQLNGYRDLCELNDVFPEKLFCVQFLPDGTYRLYPTEISSEAFRICASVYRIKNKKHPRGGIA